MPALPTPVVVYIALFGIGCMFAGAFVPALEGVVGWILIALGAGNLVLALLSVRNRSNH